MRWNPFSYLFNFVKERKRMEAINAVGRIRYVRGAKPKGIRDLKQLNKHINVSDLIK